MYRQAHVAGRPCGSNRYRLRTLDLETGRKRTVASLTDRGIVDLVGLPGAAGDPPRHAPTEEPERVDSHQRH
jgi:hypothetical protein